MQRSTRRAASNAIAVAGAVIIFATVLAACGGSDADTTTAGGAANTTAAATTSTVASTSSTTTTVADTTTLPPPTSASTTVAAPDGPGTICGEVQFATPEPVKIQIQQGSITCATAMDWMSSYANAPRSEIHGSGGFWQHGEMLCSAPSPASAPGYGYSARCKQGNDIVIGLIN